ncbi:MAG: hypothetical protein HY791_24680 [Deltaproteobacteria bacterium]|nr:hypothetical protein [Deltaproteobacteria bacterium]
MIPLLVLATQVAPPATPLEAPRLALEVLNSATTGRKLVHFDDMVGPKARSIGPHDKARGLLVYATTLDCEACESDLDKLDQAEEKVAKLGGSLVVVVLVEKREDAEAVRRALAGSKRRSIVTLDTHGLARGAFGFAAPRRTLAFRADGKSVASSSDGPDYALKKLLELLEEDR